MIRVKHMNRQKAIRVFFLIVVDVVVLVLSEFLALFVRHELSIKLMVDSGFIHDIAMMTPLYVVQSLIIFAILGLYNSLWEYISVKECSLIFAAALATGSLEYVLFVFMGLKIPPRSFPVLNILFLSVLTAANRLLYRMARVARHYMMSDRHKKRTMLVGAGEAGALVLQNLSYAKDSKNHIVCVIDDDPEKHGLRLHGVPVVGGRDSIAKNAEKYGIEEIIFAIPNCRASERRDILKLCYDTGIETKIMPGVTSVVNGEVTVQRIRKVEIEDLLGRDSVKVDLDELDLQFSGKTVLVTGGGGSIGSELCRQIAQRSPARLIIFDIYENNAYEIQQELRRKYPDLKLTVLIGSVRDEKRVRDIFDRYRPNIVYHAAAHKHVPLMEDSPCEAVKNNVFGTYHVASAADEYRAETFVMISTDKAVNPTNVMGASKRLCEMIIQMYSRKSKHTRFVAVRFGNVLGSNGSVIPLFRKQIEAGGPVTVTHKDIIRYFMTIPEAVSLVLQAGAYAKGGEIFVLDMGEPVKIDDLARNMIRLSGLEPDVDIQIEYTGLRPGEKLYEELLMSEEGLEKTANELIYIGHPGEVDVDELNAGLERLAGISAENSDEIVGEIARIVPTFHHAANR